MPVTSASSPPGLTNFLKSVSSEPIQTSIEYFTFLLQRRQIRGSKACAIATAYLLRRTISVTRASEPGKLLSRIQEVGKQLQAAAPRELSIGTIVRRVLGLIRDEEENNRDSASPADASPGSFTPQIERTPYDMSLLSSSGTIAAPRGGQEASARPPLLSSHTTAGQTRPVTSMFSILSHPTMQSGTTSPLIGSGASTPHIPPQPQHSDLRAEILEGIAEIIDELDQADEQIANYALEHIYPTETIFTYGSSSSVQRFLLKAASKRKFTVIHAEGYPNMQSQTHSQVTGHAPLQVDEADLDLPAESFTKPLATAGITVILVPDSAIFALMSRANKVILSAHAVLSNGSMIAPAGSKTVVQAASFHHVPVIVLAATYKLSPVFPHDPYQFIEYGDAARVIPYPDAELRTKLVRAKNPVWDFIDEHVDLFVTNVGSVSTAFAYRLIGDQYRAEDVEL